ncbi:MAG: SDR family oxidoreductase [Piscinibacter sp.]|jgi:2-hydroxycyclohexanecarboxyl-CoA dehydrogenase|uniref:SDR family NAD(P)-dependent oxidoreductase n=1 Tax=Piscinibacter sp. TaxID=1903157 RepID=UPI001B3D6513|nr:SDR family NAD(P)-dependent oxidoreductase [Piscinibacter sp.]MBP5990804.1 SDR family oxidoreductase [Piscinibacter sp.]MBP6028214.1 SDR family oxidoreductase [Piscinibacter sp.]
MSEPKQLAVVTGAASGIGRATASALAAQGARLIVADINAEAGERAAAELRAAGHEAEFLAVDLTDAASIAAFADAVQRKHGAVDVLVNAAGWGRTAPFWEGTPEFWQQVVALNFVGPMTLTKALLPAMMERARGKIVNVASDAGRVGSLGETVYSGAKGGLIAFTKALARETARYRINVNCVCPGPTDTPLMAAVPDKVKDALIKAIPLRRLAQPQEVADAIAFFAGAHSDYVTGQVLSVSGGLTMAG